MATTQQQIKEQTEIRRLREEQAYNEKVAELFEDKEDPKEKLERKKTDNALYFAATNALIIAGFLIIWDIATNGLRWSWQ